MKDGWTKFGFQLREKEREALRRISYAYGLSLSATIRKLIRKEAQRLDLTPPEVSGRWW